MTFVDHPITMDLKVNKYDDPVSITASMDVPDLQISWSHTFSFSDTQEVSGRNSSGVYVQVQLTQKSDDLRLNVKLLARGKTSGQDLHPTEMTVIEGNFLLKSDERGNFEWWHKLTETEKGAVIGGPLFVILFIISISCCCCCKRSNCCSCRCRCRWGYSCDISSWCLSGERTIVCSLLKAWKLTINKSYSLGPLLKLFLERLLLISFLWLTQTV